MDEENAKNRREFLCPICRNPLAEDDEEEFTRYMKHANEGRAWALRMVGDCFKKGKGVGKSLEKAFEYLLLAADKGDAVAQNYVGFMYSNLNLSCTL